MADDAVGPILNTATVAVPSEMRDFVPENDSASVLTEVVLFADGFESGDTAAWSSEESELVIEIDDEAPGEAARYVGRFTLDLSSPELGKSQIRTVLVVDKATAQPLLALGLVHHAGRLSLVGQMRSDEGSEIVTDFLDLSGEPRVIGVEWVRTEGPDGYSFEIRIGGVMRWKVENGDGGAGRVGRETGRVGREAGRAGGRGAAPGRRARRARGRGAARGEAQGPRVSQTRGGKAARPGASGENCGRHTTGEPIPRSWNRTRLALVFPNSRSSDVGRPEAAVKPPCPASHRGRAR